MSDDLERKASDDLDRSLRRVQRSVLLTLGVCALLAAAGAAGESATSAPAPPPAYLAAAVALALAAILGRGPAQRGAPSRTRVHALLLGLLAAGGLGVLGVAMGASEGLWRAGLLYTVAGVILAIRPPRSSMGAARRPGGSDPAR